jgi:glycosyltransferase involved in cell wall biosynthesis
LKKILKKSAATVVIAKPAVKILKKQGIYCRKYVVILHGCPYIPFVKSDEAKVYLRLKGRFVISTFGLISRSKGIEYAIKALPPVVDKNPQLLYLIIGETHPEVRKIEGEKYRKKLIELVYDLGLEKNVRFHNRFLSKRELIKYLQATDVYITPHISPNQISSGTLIYALGAGKAVISTLYLLAQEDLAKGRGLFCKFKDSNSITQSLYKLLDASFRNSIETTAYKYSRRFLWPNVAMKYI